ncbi:hypothetical protein Dimus_022278 [Dionaea muscipula]
MEIRNIEASELFDSPESSVYAFHNGGKHAESEDIEIKGAQKSLIKSILEDDRTELVAQAKRLLIIEGNRRGGAFQAPLDRGVISKFLHLCCEFDSADCAAALLSGDVGGTVPLVNEMDGDTGRSPLHTAAENHACRCIELLLRKRGRTDLRTKDGRALLALELALYCCRMNLDWSLEQSLDELLLQLSDKDLTAIKLLAEKTREIVDVAYAVAMKGRVVTLGALLMVAADKVNTSVLEMRTEADLGSKEKQTVYDCVIREALSLKQLSIQGTVFKGIKRTSTLTDIENEALRRLLLCEIELLQFFGAVASSSAEKKATSPLILASQAGDGEVTKLILRTNVDVNDADAEGNSALHWLLKASKGSSQEQQRIMLLLLKHGARVSQRNKWGLNAVHIAAGNGNRQALEVLILRDPDSVHIKSETKETPLFYAAMNDAVECAQLLLRFGASTEVFNLRRQRPIDLAKSQDMRAALSRVDVIITDNVLQQKYNACVDNTEYILQTQEMLMKEGLIGERTGSSANANICKYYESPAGCVRGEKCFYIHGEEDIANAKSRMRLRNDNMEACRRKIFVGGLPPSMDSDSLRLYFQENFGQVEDATVVEAETDSQVHSRGFGFVTFKDDESVSAAVEAHYVSICGKQVEIKSFLLRKSPVTTEHHEIQPQKPEVQPENYHLKPQSPSASDASTSQDGNEQMSWADRVVKGQQKSSPNKLEAQAPLPSSSDNKLPPWFTIFMNWLPRFLRRVTKNAKEGEYYALSSLKADFKAIHGLELDHASLGYSKLSDFIKSFPGLCHTKVIQSGGRGSPNHMVLMPRIPHQLPISTPTLPPLVTPPREEPIRSPEDGEVDDHKSLQYRLPPSCADIGLISGESEDNSSSMDSQKNEDDGNFNLSFLLFLEQDPVFLGRTWLIGGGFKNFDESHRPRNLVLEALARKRKEVFFLRSVYFYDDYKARVKRGICFACGKSKMLWANYPCEHLLWCNDCKLMAMQVSALGTSSHRCVMCDRVVEKIDLLPGMMITEEHRNYQRIQIDLEFPPLDAYHLWRHRKAKAILQS